MRPPRPVAARPTLYLTIFVAWAAALAWFHPRLMGLLDLAHGPVATVAVLYFVPTLGTLLQRYAAPPAADSGSTA